MSDVLARAKAEVARPKWGDCKGCVSEIVMEHLITLAESQAAQIDRMAEQCRAVLVDWETAVQARDALAAQLAEIRNYAIHITHSSPTRHELLAIIDGGN